MAIAIINPMFARISGRVGDVVFRQAHGRTIACSVPRYHPRQATAAQAQQQARFKLATVYARSALAVPAKAALYAALSGPNQRPYAIAVRDYLKPPTVDQIALGLFDGLAGDDIVITATDDTEVASVHVALKDITGQILESGPAENRADDTWVYTAIKSTPAGEPLTIEVTARDRPGNATTRTAPWAPRENGIRLVGRPVYTPLIT